MSNSGHGTVMDVMLKGGVVGTVDEEDIFRTALEALNKNRWGAVPVVDADGKLVGILTDGDIRRTVLNTQDPLPKLYATVVANHMTTDPITIRSTESIRDCLSLMNDRSVGVLPVVDRARKLLGMVFMQHALREYLKSS